MPDLDDNPFVAILQDARRDTRFAYEFRQLARDVRSLVVERRARPGRGFDLLQMLLDARDADTGEAMSDAEVVDEVMTLVVAGHETTASTLNWTWWLLATNPDVQERVAAEQLAADDLGHASYADLIRMPYTRQVVDESMRLYPPGWLLTRRSIGPDTLGGYELPPGTDVFISPYLVHRHPATGVAGGVRSGTFRPGAGRSASRIRVHSVCGRAASLHRAELRAVRDPAPPESRGAPLPADRAAAGAACPRGAHQPADDRRRSHENRTTMIKYQTLPDMLDDRARGDGAIVYLEGEGAEKTLKLADLRRRALGILFHLQRIGAQPGDHLILHVASNEQFIDAYWACLYGGIVPVPVAVGISDEHKHKLLRIARQLGQPLLYTDRKLRDRLATFAATPASPRPGLRSSRGRS